MAVSSRLTFILPLVCVSLARASIIKDHLKIGLTLGSSSTKPDSPHHYCTDPHEQLLKNLYVDYFHSSGPCIVPGGSKVFTFRNTEYGSDDEPYTRATICAKVPWICQLLGRERGRGILDISQMMMASFSHSMKSLYQLLTGRSSLAATPSPTSDSRHSTSYLQYDAIVSPSECDNGGVGDFVFPVVGRSALTNTTVTIMQAFPDLVQPVFFRKCRTHQSQLVYGKCIQEYLPVSFFVTPSYPGALLAQDFIMVESGCHVAAHVMPHYKEKIQDKHLQDDFTAEVHKNMEKIRSSDRRLF
ncbi:hypothetical protein Hamer_G017320 [Homarus americanus]|uniref:Uncharacterized protein n=1 Tax=Homarus americanus TaxID=6706 RepID=A0A8J5JV33_HOMAM|nr:hypothetical protein Hamer_G017320 [Homarus americanus]